MKLDVSTSDQFERLLDALASDIITAAVHYRLHKDLRQAVPEYEREFMQTRAFWSLTFDAHLITALHSLFRAYDQYPGTLSLKSLLETIQENLHFFGGDSTDHDPDAIVRGATPPRLEDIRKDLSGVVPADPLVRNLIALRGNLYVHRNAKNIVHEIKVSQLFPISYENLDELVARAVRILNRYSGLFRNSSWSTQMIGHDDWKHILKYVREALKRDEEELQEELRRFKKRNEE